MDIDVHSLAFWQDAIQVIAGDVEKFMEAE